MRTRLALFIACTVSAIVLMMRCTQPAQTTTQLTVESAQRYLLASRWHIDTTKNSYLGTMPLCPGGVGGFDTLDFISPTTVLTSSRDGSKREQSWELQTVLLGPNPRQGVQLLIGGNNRRREYPITYCNRDTLILGTPWLDADCDGFRMLAKAK
jgi:hypothetical protein